ESRGPDQRLRIAFSDVHKRTDTPRPSGLLRVCGKRPPRGRSNKQLDELAPSHPQLPRLDPYHSTSFWGMLEGGSRIDPARIASGHSAASTDFLCPAETH